MSSPERAKRAKPTGKAASRPASKSAAKPKAARKSAKSGEAEPTGAEKAAFLKAMAKGIEPGTVAARKVAAKKDGLPDTAEATPPLAPSAGADDPVEAPKVEVLRRIPAAPKVENTPESEEALRLAAMIEKAVEDGALGKVQPHAQQALIGALVKLYAANAEAGERYAPLGMRSAVTATDVMVVCGALLKAVDLQVFELGMWQSWSSG